MASPAGPFSELQSSLERLKAGVAQAGNPLSTSLVGGPENMKLLFDRSANDILGGSPSANPWEAMRLGLVGNMFGNLVALSNRVNNQAADYDFAVKMGSVLAAQAGVTEQQSQVTPVRTAAADTQVQQPAGAVYPPIRSMDQTGAVATGGVSAAIANITAQMSNLTDTVTKLAEALLPVIVNSAGGASTPSQTQPKPATA